MTARFADLQHKKTIALFEGQHHSRRPSTAGQVGGGAAPDASLPAAVPVREVAQVLEVHGQVVLLRQAARRFRVQVLGPAQRRNSASPEPL